MQSREFIIPFFVYKVYNVKVEKSVKTKRVKIKAGEDYITLQNLLKICDVIPTGGMAKFFLSENTVLVNDSPEDRRGRKLYDGDVVKVLGQEFIIVK